MMMMMLPMCLSLNGAGVDSGDDDDSPGGPCWRMRDRRGGLMEGCDRGNPRAIRKNQYQDYQGYQGYQGYPVC